MEQSAYLKTLDADRIHVTTRPYLKKVAAHSEPYETEVFGQSLTVLPGVMSPKYDWAGLYMIQCLPGDLAGKEVLELGSGSGLVSVFAALRGADSVTATDVNPAAVENTLLNFEKFNLKDAVALQSDVFSSVPKKKYDVIIFNLPYHDSTPTNELEKGVMDENYEVMKAFLAGIRDFLARNGALYIGFSRSGDIATFEKELAKRGIRIDEMRERNTWNDPAYRAPEFHYNCQVYIGSIEQEKSTYV